MIMIYLPIWINIQILKFDFKFLTKDYFKIKYKYEEWPSEKRWNKIKRCSIHLQKWFQKMSTRLKICHDVYSRNVNHTKYNDTIYYITQII